MLVFRIVSLLAIASFAAILGVKAMDISGMARAYPTALVVLVLAGTAAMMASTVAGRREAIALKGDLARLAASSGGERRRLFAFVALWMVYPTAMTHLGFTVATTVIVTGSFWLLGQRRRAAGLLSAAAFSVVFAVLFATVFYVPVPAGPFDNWLHETLFALSR